jgi:hypothetical protein
MRGVAYFQRASVANAAHVRANGSARSPDRSRRAAMAVRVRIPRIRQQVHERCPPMASAQAPATHRRRNCIMKASIGRFACSMCLAFVAVMSVTAGAVTSGKGDMTPSWEPLVPSLESDAHQPPSPSLVAGYAYDPAFADHGVSIDRFAGSPGYYRGEKMLRLANGDVIVAGTVLINGADQLGIVRYSPSGRRQTWAGITPAYSRYNGQYIVYPNDPAADPKLSHVADIKRYNGNLYVLATQTYRASNGLDKYQPVIVVFSENGVYRGWWFVRIDDDVYNNPLAMDISGNGRLTLLAGNSGGGLWTRLWTARFEIAAGGAPVLDPAFGNGGASLFELPASLSACPAALGGNCPISAVDIAHEAGFVLPANPPFYVTFTKKYDNNCDHDPCLAAFNGTGELRTAFNGNGVRCYPFDDAGSNRDDEAIAIDTDFHVMFGNPVSYVQDIHLLTGVSRQYSSGSGLLRVDSTGTPVTQFGGTGKILWGGCGAGCTVDLGDDIPLAFTRRGADLGVVGHWKPNLVDQPELSIVDAMTGAIRDFHVHGIAAGDANYNDVVGDTFGFTGAGWAKDGASNRMFVTSRLIPAPLADDTIFRYGCE